MAMRRVGEMLAETERAIPGPFPEIGTNLVPISDRPPTLAEIGLSKKESALAQKLAALPGEEFEQIKDGAGWAAGAIGTVSAGPIWGSKASELRESYAWY